MTMPRRLAKYLKKHHIQFDVIDQCLRVWTDDFTRITKARRGDFAVSGAPLLVECCRYAA